jgi:hypothetical protein
MNKNNTMIMKDELEKIWKGMVFRVPWGTLPEGIPIIAMCKFEKVAALK